MNYKFEDDVVEGIFRLSVNIDYDEATRFPDDLKVKWHKLLAARNPQLKDIVDFLHAYTQEKSK